MKLKDADELIEILDEEYRKDKSNVWKYLLINLVKQILSDAPTIDAEPVVRCKDCKWRGERGCAARIVDESDRPKDDDFCSWGERKKE